jgi:hypothetical protein
MSNEAGGFMNAIMGRFGMIVGCLLLGTPATAALIDHGSAGQYFHDTATGLYWYDPAQLVGQTRAQMDAFATASAQWEWATAAQIEALDGQSSEGGVALETVLGARQYTLVTGGPRWLGYYAETGQPDGWAVQASASPDTISHTGFQHDAASFQGITGVGGWMVSRVDPVPEPQTLSLVAAGALLAVARLRRRRAHRA